MDAAESRFVRNDLCLSLIKLPYIIVEYPRVCGQSTPECGETRMKEDGRRSRLGTYNRWPLESLAGPDYLQSTGRNTPDS